MVRITSALIALSISLTVAFGHGVHDLEKRAAAGGNCPKTYQPVAAGQYPALDCVPFVQDPQVQAWLKLVDFTKTPKFAQSNAGACPADLTTLPKDQCWWTCQKCESPTDVVTCPTPGTWGLTYDDGPSPNSTQLYDVLKQHNQKATLFIVGSRAISYPATLKRAYEEGHHIAMTSLTNEQIVAELKWTEKAIFDVIGVTPLYWRPPFGDVDNRVRDIATQLGYKTAIWTQGFDTDDWNIPAKTATFQSVVDTFKSWLVKIPTMKTGFIVLEHDLFPEEVNVSVNGILPIAFQTKGLTMQPIPQCIGDAKPYKEGAGTFKFVGTPNNTSSGGSTPGGNSKSSALSVHHGKTANSISSAFALGAIAVIFGGFY
ncbi:chitin deacetylase [Actinomortierella ambigua]|nr:chitin deacetylase [Actinomortierella ambigua]